MRISVATLSIAVATLFSFAAQADDWYRWRGADLNGISKETGWQSVWPANGPKQLWEASVGTGYASFSAARGRVYTTGNANDTDTIYCFDAASGTTIWKQSYPSLIGAKYNEGGTSATPTIDGDKVYQLGKWGDLLCLEAATGKILWSTNVAKEFDLQLSQWGFASSPLIDGDMLILNAGTAGLALDKNTGKALWTSGPQPAGYGTPEPWATAGGRALVVMGSNMVYAVQQKDGKELWRFPWKSDAGIDVAQPVVEGDTVFVSAGYGTGAALLKMAPGKPEVVWQNKSMRNHFSSCIYSGGFLYGFDGQGGQGGGSLKCMELKTGEVKWTENMPVGSLMAADSKLIIITGRGELVVASVSPDAFKPISRAQVLSGKCWTTPVLSNGRIFCRNTAGHVVCLDVSGK